MSQIDDLMAQIPIGQLAGRLGVSEAEAEQAVRQALPALVGGMAANAQDPQGAASLSRALGEHDGSLVEGGVDLDRVDTDDGRKIVHNIFGEQEEAVVNQLGGLGGGSGLIAKLLPMLAPLLMSYLGKSIGGGRGAAASAPAAGSGDTGGLGPGDAAAQDGGGGLGGGLGEVLGGGGAGGGLGDVLGGLLGGGGGAGRGGLGGLGDVLGGLLGHGKR